MVTMRPQHTDRILTAYVYTDFKVGTCIRLSRLCLILHWMHSEISETWLALCLRSAYKGVTELVPQCTDQCTKVDNPWWLCVQKVKAHSTLSYLTSMAPWGVESQNKEQSAVKKYDRFDSWFYATYTLRWAYRSVQCIGRIESKI